MIQARELCKTYSRGGDEVLACYIDRLDIAQGEQVAVIGKSGLGKTTLLNMIAGIVRPTSGSVKVAGTELSRLSEAQRDKFRGRHIGIVFQTFNLLVPFTALENVLLGAVFGRGADSEMHDRARDLLERAGLADRMNHRPNHLSVGQVQRVALCRALINGPELILADEPLGNQDRETGGEALKLLCDIASDEERTVVMVTHDPGSAALMNRTIDLADLRSVAS